MHPSAALSAAPSAHLLEALSAAPSVGLVPVLHVQAVLLACREAARVQGRAAALEVALAEVLSAERREKKRCVCVCVCVCVCAGAEAREEAAMERRKEQQKRVGGGEGRVSNRQLEMGAGGNGGMQWGASAQQRR